MRCSPLKRSRLACTTNTLRQKHMTLTAELTNDSAPQGQAPRQPESPQAEIGRRFADVAPVWPVAHAAGLQNQRAIWADAEIKRKMDRAVQAKLLGVEEVLAGGNDEMAGDINIKGDETHTHQHYYQPPASKTAAPIAALATTGLRRFVWPAVLGAATLGTGAAGMAIFNHFTQKTGQPAGQFEYSYGIESKPRQ